MTTTELERTETPSDGGQGLPEASLGESLRFVATGLLPSLARGLFSPRPRAMKLLTRLDTDSRAIDVLAAIRAKHGGQGARVLRGKMAVLWGEPAIREVLDKSADVYASDAGAKQKGMSHFQPDALTLSRGDEWKDRRAFNESVLATSEKVHPQGGRFLDVVRDEVGRLNVHAGLRWPQWEQLFDRITLRIIFGDSARDDQELTALLEQLMKEANRIGGLKTSDAYYELYGRLERKLANPDPYSLIARFADAPQTDTTRVVQQIPHWIFAMRDTLGANAYRALAVIVADAAVERRAREEIDGADLTDPQAVGGLSYLGGVLHETMRLWPTTPLLARETTRETTLAGEKLPEGTQVMLLNVFNHRDPDTDGSDELRPERWQSGERNYRFNHLSNGTQDCPGGPMVMLLGQAVLAQVLSTHKLRLENSPIERNKPLPRMLDFFQLTFRPA